MKYDIPIESDAHAEWCMEEAERRYGGKLIVDSANMMVVEDGHGITHTDAVLRAVPQQNPTLIPQWKILDGLKMMMKTDPGWYNTAMCLILLTHSVDKGIELKPFDHASPLFPPLAHSLAHIAVSDPHWRQQVEMLMMDISRLMAGQDDGGEDETDPC